MNYRFQKHFFNPIRDFLTNTLHIILAIIVADVFFLDNPNSLDILRCFATTYLFYLVSNIYNFKLRSISLNNISKKYLC